MTDEHDRTIARLHPEDRRLITDDLAVLLRAAMQAPALPPPERPPANMDGLDAQTFRKAARIEFEKHRDEFRSDIEELVRQATKNYLVGDEIDRRCAQIVQDRTKDFVPEIKINDKIVQMFEDLGLPVDTPANRRETGERLRRMLRWERNINLIVGGAVVTGLGSALWAVLRLIGVNLPGTPGSH